MGIASSKLNITIRATPAIVQEILIQHRFIKYWDTGYNKFREIHVLQPENQILHWDIEEQVSYTFDLTTDKNMKTTLSILAIFDGIDQSGNCLDDMVRYIRVILQRIKRNAEHQQRVVESATNLTHFTKTRLNASG